MRRYFHTFGVRFIAINDNIDTASGISGAEEMLIPFKNLINDAYCRDISIKIRSHLDIKRKNGQYIGSFAPYGYKKSPDDKNKLIVDEKAASVVCQIFKWKISGMSGERIAEKLNELGIPTPMEYKHSLGIRIQDNFKMHEQAGWSSMSVRRILENEVYVGTLVQGRYSTPNHKIKKIVDKPKEEWIRIEDSHEPIVSKREFAIVQRLLGMDTRTSPNEDEVYVLSGLAVCAGCGAAMIKRNVPAGGKVYSYYICSKNAATKGCGTHRIPKEKLESLVFEVLKAHIANVLDTGRILEYIDTVPFQELEIKELERQKEAKEQEIRRCRELRDMLYEDLKDGIVSKEDYAELYEGYNNKRKKAEETVRKLSHEIRNVLEAKTDKYEWLRYFKEYQNISGLSRMAAVELIDRVRVFDKDHIEIDFNFQDCFQSALRRIQSAGCTVCTGENGRVTIRVVSETQ